MRLLADLAALAMRYGLPVRTACPLCVGTPREPLTYEAEQLAAHALAAHDFEDLYDFTRDMAERCDQSELVGMVDASYDIVTELTTSYDEYVTGATAGEPDSWWGWTCERCGRSVVGHATQQAAREHRIQTHRCRA